MKFLSKTNSSNLFCFSIDFGVGVYRKYGLEVGPLLFINPSYMYSFRLSNHFFFTTGIDLNFQNNIYIYHRNQNAVTLGLTTGILF